MKSIATYAALFAVVSLPLWASLLDSGDREPLVNEATVKEALASQTPSRLPGSDELEFFRARRLERDDDVVAARRIAAAHLMRFQAYGRDEDLAGAESTLESLLALRPTDADLWSRRAQIHLSRHEFQRALDAAQHAVDLAPPAERELHRLRLFDALFALGRYDEAERLLELPSDRKAFSYRVREARLRDRLGDVETARDLMRESLRLAEAYAQPSTVLAWNHVELGHFEYHSGNPDGAVTHYREALRIAPGYPAALEGLGWIAYGMDGDAEKADSLFTRALENGGHQDLRLALAELALFRGDSTRAYDQVGRLATLAARDMSSRRLLSEPLALALSDTETEAALLLSRENLAERRTAESLAVHGWVLHQLGDKEGARTLFDEAVGWGTPQPMVFYLAGRHAAEAGERDKARRWLREARDGSAELGPRRASQVQALLESL
ncbi:MAG: tetratricopeptide repeat protein [Gemmatimonadetes bacterium]|nr:tetratricopeptide repeat protein [Gemmatimonadota bacterium]